MTEAFYRQCCAGFFDFWLAGSFNWTLEWGAPLPSYVFLIYWSFCPVSSIFSRHSGPQPSSFPPHPYSFSRVHPHMQPHHSLSPHPLTRPSAKPFPLTASHLKPSYAYLGFPSIHSLSVSLKAQKTRKTEWAVGIPEAAWFCRITTATTQFTCIYTYAYVYTQVHITHSKPILVYCAQWLFMVLLSTMKQSIPSSMRTLPTPL